jgi:hypothetical protein
MIWKSRGALSTLTATPLEMWSMVTAVGTIIADSRIVALPLSPANAQQWPRAVLGCNDNVNITISC